MDYSTKTLAKGCFGKIYKEDYNGKWAALKKVPSGFISREQLERECKVYYRAHHNNVVKLLGDPWLQDGKWHIPLEFIFGEDLETTIFSAQKSKISLTPKVKATIITGMCEGLFHLHSKDIVHQDLKPDNIMVEHETHRAVIIDMGLAKLSVNGLSSAQNMGNEAYSAPEILQANGIRDKRSDVWAMGKMVAELIARVRLPTTFVSPVKIQETLKDNPYCSVVSKMVASNPTERASMVGVISEIRRAGVIYGADVTPKPGAGTGWANPGLGAQAVVKAVPASVAAGPNQRNRPPAPLVHKEPAAAIPQIRTPYPVKAAPAPVTPPRINRSPSPNNRNPYPINRNPPPINRSPPPKADALVPITNAELAAKFSLMSLPPDLPKDGTVIQRRFDGEMQQLQYKEIVMKDGKVVKYDDVRYMKP
ncbi:serine/threonine-protein kinase Aurora-3-like [Astyanax mexicanus]|uniref:Serine/threonine-protein kinase Aurora-3-like n=1 Tax=Astyanax mexicanus TaxID=7994 RepID=A0A8T2MPK6_ASTMX|nr:serine/threonine-protein kinase Aurora-3-like [Astyanax mexicanus]